MTLPELSTLSLTRTGMFDCHELTLRGLIE